MKTIWKYEIEVADELELELPIDAEVVMVGLQHGGTFLWAIVDSKSELERRQFFIRGTGHPLPDDVVHVYSWQSPPFVWHLLEPDTSRR